VDEVAPDWWAKALALHERLPPGPGSASADPAPGWAPRRLADLGLDGTGLRVLLDESPRSLAARVKRPGWVDFVERSIADLAPDTDPAVPPGDWRTAFGIVVAAFLDTATAEFDRRIEHVVACGRIDPVAARDGFAAGLRRRLVRLATRTLVLELNVARLAGRLTGDTPEERFDDFARRVATRPGLTKLCVDYPVLARLVGQCCLHAVEAGVELLTRFAHDRAAIVEHLLGGVDPGDLVGAETEAGDPHRRGRSVVVVRFADGRSAVYKPRPLDLHAHFVELIDWLNTVVDGPDLRSTAVLARTGYGWSEFVRHEPCADLHEVSRFYRRKGVLLALLYAVDGTDVHYENVIACADQPLLVDVETLFHPTPPPLGSVAADPAAAALASSVCRTGLLPQLMFAEHGVLDVSGLGGDPGSLPSTAIAWSRPGTDEMRLVREEARFTGGRNRPVLDGRDVEPTEHQAALLAGFRAGYHAIVAHKAEFTALVRGCGTDDVRVIVRPTVLYATLLDELTHPDVLRDALDRDRALDLLWDESAVDPLRAPLIRHELADLWAGDVPIFTTRPSTTDVWTSVGDLVPGLLPEPCLAPVEAKIDRMSEVDRRDQEWLITAGLATRTARTADQHHAEPLPGAIAATVPDPDFLLAAARGIADQIVAHARHGGDRANWLGVEEVGDRNWAVLPMGGGLADGYSGVALFLAQLARLTHVSRYLELAHAAVRPVPALLDALAAEPRLARAIGSGGFAGLGGTCYALARLGTLLGDEPAGWLPAAVDVLAECVDEGSTDIATGTAGGLAAMLAVHAETGLESAWLLARRQADQLVDSTAWLDLPAGFALGTSGVGWALLRYAAAGGGERYAEVGREALARNLDLADWPAGRADHGWCKGTAGIVLAHADTAGEALPGDPERVLDAVVSRPPLRDMSLCHGELGAVEALIVLAEQGSGRAAGALLRRTGIVLGALEQHGPRCGTPGGVPSPGLLTGLAGIGYGLLRLGFADRVPSVLLLRPATIPRSTDPR